MSVLFLKCCGYYVTGATIATVLILSAKKYEYVQWRCSKDSGNNSYKGGKTFVQLVTRLNLETD